MMIMPYTQTTLGARAVAGVDEGIIYKSASNTQHKGLTYPTRGGAVMIARDMRIVRARDGGERLAD